MVLVFDRCTLSAAGTLTGSAGTDSAGTSGVELGKVTATVGSMDAARFPSAATVAVGLVTVMEGLPLNHSSTLISALRFTDETCM